MVKWIHMNNVWYNTDTIIKVEELEKELKVYISETNCISVIDKKEIKNLKEALDLN